MGDQDIRAALDRHWAASEASDDDAEDKIYHDDAVLEYIPSPASASVVGSPSGRRGGCFPTSTSPFCALGYRICHQLCWAHTVSIMEFRDGKVFRETQYFGDPFEPWSERAQWVERID
jgi:propanediol dehydratase large subunit